MRTIARFMDARNTAEGKFLSVLLSVLLVFSFLNVTMFTDYAGADTTPEGDGTEIVTPLEDVEEPEAQPEDEADGPESEEPAEEVNETEPAAEPETPAVAEEREAAAEEAPAPESFEGYAHVGSITVKVTAEAGVVPAGTEVHAKRVSDGAVREAVEEAVAEEGKALDGYEAIDVTLVKDGQEIQPNGKVNVCFFDANLEGEDVAVYHVADDASAVTEVDARQADADVQSFDVEHFSIYVVAGATDSRLVTYEFYNGEEKVNTQIVAEGDTVLEPAAPVSDDKNEVFFCWTLDPEAETIAPFEFGAQGAVDASKTVKVYASFGKPARVNFCDEAGVVKVTKEGLLGQVLSYEDVTFAVGSDKAVVGYKDQAGKEYGVTDEIELSAAEINLTAIVESVKWVTYDTGDGATIIAPDSYSSDEPTVEPVQPERRGYTFAGWLDKATGEQFAFGSAIDKNVDLEAKWNAAQADVRVIYWKQSLNDSVDTPDDEKTYDFAASQVVKNYKTGDRINVAALSNNVLTNNGAINTNSTSNVDWRGFRYNANTSYATHDAVVQADGTTVINVRYDRVKCTVTFDRGGSAATCTVEEHSHTKEPGSKAKDHQGETIGCYTSTKKGNKWSWQRSCGKEEHKHSNGKCPIKVEGLFGQNLPLGTWNGDYGWDAEGNDTSTGAVLLATFDFYTASYGDETEKDASGDLSLRFTHKDAGGFAIHYYNEDWDGSFRLAQTVRTSSNASLYEKFAGYEPYKQTNVISNPEISSSWNNATAWDEGASVLTGYWVGWNWVSAAEVYVSSKLKTHTIYYYDGADSARAEIPNVKYTTPLNGSVTGVEYNAKPTPECVAHHPGMKFAGWYKDPALSEKFDFANATMPNADLALYAKFEPVQFDLSFDVNGGNDGEEFADQRVDYGTKIGELPVPVKPGYEFGGWKLDGKPVSPQATITDDTKLVATWIPKGVIKIKYVDQNGKEIPGLDGASYSADALAKVKAPGDKVVPTGDEKFLYWKADDGRAYYPGTSVAASIAKADSETDTA